MWLLIGYGSALHGDDRFGQVVAEEVCRAGDHQIEVLRSVQLTPEYAQPIAAADGVIFVDISIDLRPGQIRLIFFPPGDQANPAAMPAITHHCTPDQLLTLARVLYGAAPPAWIFSVGASDMRLGDALSPEVSSAVPVVVTGILRLVRDTAALHTRVNGGVTVAH